MKLAILPPRVLALVLSLLICAALAPALATSSGTQQCGGITLVGEGAVDVPAVLAPTPLAPGFHPLGSLKPWLECVTTGAGTITAYFGWNNPTGAEIVVPAGTNNQFVPNPADRSQTTQFLPGRSRYFPVFAFQVQFDATSSATWQLNGYEVVANSTSALCETEWIRFELTVTGQTAPTDAEVAAVVAAAAAQMNVATTQIVATVQGAGLGTWEIVMNVTQPATPNPNLFATPYVAIKTLFGDNVKFSAFINATIAAGLVPSDANTMPTGKELEGWPIPGTTPSAPSAPSNSTPSTIPTSPDAPTSPTTPSPGFATPSNITTPSNAPEAPGEKLIFSLIFAVGFMILLSLCM